MPWIEALLRGQKVLARVKADGSFDAEGGRVEIRYKATDAKAYRAAGSNLSAIPGGKVLADDACVAGVAVAASTTEKKKAPKASSRGHESAPPEEGSWIAYTDGACSGNPGPAGSGVTILAPDGKIVYAADDGDIWTINREGGEQRQPTNNPFKDFSHCVSPDGRALSILLQTARVLIRFGE